MTDDAKIRFNWTRSNHFRVIHADGAYGGLTPYGNVFFTLYSDHPVFPETTVHSVSEEGVLGPEISGEKKLKDGVERELEVSVVMALPAAKALHAWLAERIGVLESLGQSQQESEVKE